MTDEPEFKVGDLVLVEVEESLEDEISRVAHHESGHAIVAGCCGAQARARIWFEGGELVGLTKRSHVPDLTKIQLMCIGLGGVVGELLCFEPDCDTTAPEALRRLYEGLGPGDAKTAGVPHHRDEPDYETDEQFAKAVGIVTTILRDHLNAEWKEMARELIETVVVE